MKSVVSVMILLLGVTAGASVESSLAMMNRYNQNVSEALSALDSILTIPRRERFADHNLVCRHIGVINTSLDAARTTIEFEREFRTDNRMIVRMKETEHYLKKLMFEMSRLNAYCGKTGPRTRQLDPFEGDNKYLQGVLKQSWPLWLEYSHAFQRARFCGGGYC